VANRDGVARAGHELHLVDRVPQQDGDDVLGELSRRVCSALEAAVPV
jgi:hypothetical protein